MTELITAAFIRSIHLISAGTAGLRVDKVIVYI